MWEFKLKREYEAQVQDLERCDAVQAMRSFPQHVKGFSTHDHASLVAYSSFRICRALGLDARAAARGGLLHDMFLYNWMEYRSPIRFDHMLNHARYALENARRHFTLTDAEEDIIASHMWPANPFRFYRCWEAFIVSCMDKLCTAAELLHLVPLITRAG